MQEAREIAHRGANDPGQVPIIGAATGTVAYWQR
jgi:hypothetical protein